MIFLVAVCRDFDSIKIQVPFRPVSYNMRVNDESRRQELNIHHSSRRRPMASRMPLSTLSKPGALDDNLLTTNTQSSRIKHYIKAVANQPKGEKKRQPKTTLNFFLPSFLSLGRTQNSPPISFKETSEFPFRFE